MASKLHIALIQSILHWESPDDNLTMFEKKIMSISSDCDLIILPEMFSTGFTMSTDNVESFMGQKTLEWMQRMAQAKNAALVGSIVFNENGKNYNRLFFVFPNGEYSSYDKRHTFTLAGEHEVYESGNAKLIVEFKGFKICPLICYDLRFPVWSRNIENYDMLLYVANWPKPRIGAWDTLLRARAIENMAYCIGVNRIGKDEQGYEYPGHSGVYDVLGSRLAYAEIEETLYATLEKSHIEKTRNKLKFLEDRDRFSLK